MTELIKSNNFNKYLYISVLPEKIASQCVAKNNGAVLFYEEDLQTYQRIYVEYGIKKVKYIK